MKTIFLVALLVGAAVCRPNKKAADDDCEDNTITSNGGSSSGSGSNSGSNSASNSGSSSSSSSSGGKIQIEVLINLLGSIKDNQDEVVEQIITKMGMGKGTDARGLIQILLDSLLGWSEQNNVKEVDAEEIWNVWGSAVGGDQKILGIVADIIAALKGLGNTAQQMEQADWSQYSTEQQAAIQKIVLTIKGLQLGVGGVGNGLLTNLLNGLLKVVGYATSDIEAILQQLVVDLLGGKVAVTGQNISGGLIGDLLTGLLGSLGGSGTKSGTNTGTSTGTSTGTTTGTTTSTNTGSSGTGTSTSTSTTTNTGTSTNTGSSSGTSSGGGKGLLGDLFGSLGINGEKNPKPLLTGVLGNVLGDNGKGGLLGGLLGGVLGGSGKAVEAAKSGVAGAAGAASGQLGVVGLLPQVLTNLGLGSGTPGAVLPDALSGQASSSTSGGSIGLIDSLGGKGKGVISGLLGGVLG